MTIQLSKVPPGDYIVGDPCYTLSDDEYDEFLDAGPSFAASIDQQVWLLSTGRVVSASHTAFGDGVYDDNRGYAYGVDSGMLGIVSREFGQYVPSYTQPHYLNDSIDPVRLDRDGIVHIGDVKIETDPEEENGWESNFDEEEGELI